MQVTLRAAGKHRLVQTPWFHTLSKCTFVCSGSPADGEANGRQVAGRTKDSQFQRQHPQPETLHPRCPPHVVEEQTSGQVPGRQLTCSFQRVQWKDLLDELAHFPLLCLSAGALLPASVVRLPEEPPLLLHPGALLCRHRGPGL